MLGESLKGIEEAFNTLFKKIENLNKRIEALEAAIEKTGGVLPEWISSKKSLEILSLKDVETLNKYAEMGLVEKQKGADNKNYYKSKDIISLPNKLIGQKARR